ncbi:MAG: hypothetical protein HYX74_07705, partial [Acidobacteria bacterium]|nr:hypothetical protein [Acidobacteriota bacterium]
MGKKSSSALAVAGQRRSAARGARRDPLIPIRWYPWIVVALPLLAYANTLRNGLMWDDIEAIQGNPLVASLDVGAIFTTAYWYPDPKLTDLYRPVTVFSFALNHALGGFSPSMYHLTNILLHAANSLFVFL